MRPSPVVGRIVVVTAAERTAELAGATWLPDIVTDVVAAETVGRSRSLPGSRRSSATGRTMAASSLSMTRRGRSYRRRSSRRSQKRRLCHGAAIPVVPVAETLKRVEDDVVTGTVERDGLAAAQTPQGVRRGLLREAYRRFPADGPETWTDEASLLEACSIHVHVVEGDPVNLKVTVPGDVPRAIAGLAAVSGPGATRTGIGHDSHPFGPGMPLMLGGVEIPGRAAAPRSFGRRCRAPRSRGRAPGRGCVWAISDACSRRTRGRREASTAGSFSRRCGGDSRLVDGGRLSVDVTIVAARPRLAGHLDGMATALADLLGLDRAAVNVKASTGNLDGAEGAGRSISALAVATLASLR